jgi:uncharacterized protein (DUF2267 family)
MTQVLLTAKSPTISTQHVVELRNVGMRLLPLLEKAALRDRLPVPEAAHLGAQLPMLVRGFYYDNWKPASTPSKIKTAQEFYDVVQENFAADRNVNPMRLTEAVMKALSANLSPGELEKLRGIFSPHLREIWPKNEPTVDLSDLG